MFQAIRSCVSGYARLCHSLAVARPKWPMYIEAYITRIMVMVENKLDRYHIASGTPKPRLVLINSGL